MSAYGPKADHLGASRWVQIGRTTDFSIEQSRERARDVMQSLADLVERIIRRPSDNVVELHTDAAASS